MRCLSSRFEPCVILARVALTVQALDLDSLRSHSFRVLPCSARTGDNLLDGFDWLVGEISQRMYFTAPISGALEGADVVPGLATATSA